MKLRDALKKKLSKKELSVLKTSYDSLGSLAIMEIPDELVKKEKLIGETLLKLQKNIKTVAKKVGKHYGEFRKQRLKIIAGVKKKETEYKENGIRLLLHAENVYFSPRLSTERKRVMEKVRPGESVLVMFSGCGPYTCAIAKNTKAKEVYGIEINPEAHKYAEKNLLLNKIKNAKVFLGDVRKVIPKLKKRFDRIAMPLPKSAEDFIDVALKASKKGTIIHFYDFEHENDIPEASLGKIKKAMGKRRYRVLEWRKCGEYSPRKYRVVVDFKVL